MSVANNNLSQDSSHPDHHSQSRLCENAAISLNSLHVQEQFVNRKCCGTVIDNFILVHFILTFQDYSIYETKPTIGCPCRCKVLSAYISPEIQLFKDVREWLYSTAFTKGRHRFLSVHRS
ncbi:hypothetical protein P5673_000837 [Acropora cervicornis]|uniref:Uncharacterized protein n=1 Tax=Acropora cervicornis TaxID=6130 RepID=A0AAD9R7M8_ACRCE|nr:hypothetical protein P5673_000837 [Acropora cervicornis]